MTFEAGHVCVVMDSARAEYGILVEDTDVDCSRLIARMCEVERGNQA